MIHDLKKYKNAKGTLPHLEAILKVLDLTERSLKIFSFYIPVAKILLVIKEERLVIESYRHINSSIKNNKGLKNNN